MEKSSDLLMTRETDRGKIEMVHSLTHILPIFR